MNIDKVSIRPIKPNEWLPDRCLKFSEQFDPKSYLPESGSTSLNNHLNLSREDLLNLYHLSIKKYGGCGFVAWDKDKVIAYHNFFPAEMAQNVRFYGYGVESYQYEATLIHNCLTIVKGDYLRRGISSRLVNESICWAKANGWKRFEVHLTLPDCEKAWQADQKSCLSFWKQFGFRIYKEHDADEKTAGFYGVSKRYSMYLQLDRKPESR